MPKEIIVSDSNKTDEELKNLLTNNKVTNDILSDTPVKEYVVQTQKHASLALSITLTRLLGNKHSCKAIIEEYVCGEKSGDYNKDDDGIEAIEMMSDEEESPTEIAQCESLFMFDQLLHMTGISEINRNASPQAQDVNSTYIRHLM